jgi:hypothetical protein
MPTTNLCPETIIEQTKRWLDDFVIALNLCPFARLPYQQDRVRYRVVGHSADNLSQQWLDIFWEECQHLDGDDKTETTLLIFPDALASFDDYLAFVDVSEMLLERLGYVGRYQLASFHPAYCFADSDDNDPANYTNRSPWPMLHLLREQSISQAADSPVDLDVIPQRNINVLRALDSTDLARRLHTLQTPVTPATASDS